MVIFCLVISNSSGSLVLLTVEELQHGLDYQKPYFSFKNSRTSSRFKDSKILVNSFRHNPAETSVLKMLRGAVVFVYLQMRQTLTI